MTEAAIPYGQTPQAARGYLMVREAGEAKAYVVEPSGTRGLPHVVRHSPTGFEWGYGGSGPADLARSILIDAAGGILAEGLYQEFKREFVASLPYDGGTISLSQIHEFLCRKGVQIG